MSDFCDFVNGLIKRGDVMEAVRMWRGEYASARYRGWTALHWMCGGTMGDKKRVVRVLLDRGCDIEAETHEEGIGWRSIHICASRGNQDALRVLLEAGCSLTALTSEGETPLQIAERRNHHGCASMLKTAIQKMKDFEKMLLKGVSLATIVEPETGTTLLDKLWTGKNKRFMESIKAKKVSEKDIEEWKSLKLKQVNSKSFQSLRECLVYRCIQHKYDSEVYNMCTTDIVNKASLFFGSTALETAVDCGAVVWVYEILRKLVRVDKSWLAAEDIARKKNLSNISELIAKRRDYLTHKAEKGISRLHIAVIENDPDTVDYIINKDSVGVDGTHKNLGSALSLAYNIDHIDCIRSLQANNINVNTVDRFLQTPLHVAISNKTENLSEYLLDHTRDIECTDIFGLTALAQSVLNDCRDICKILVRKGAVCDKYVEIIPRLLEVHPAISNIPRMPITNRETIYSLCLKSNRNIYPCLLESMDTHSVNQPDGNYNSLLHISAVSLMPDLCSQLIAKSADVNFKNDSESTPLLELLKQNSEGNMNEIQTQLMDTVNVLIDGGASPDVEDTDGSTVFEKATLYHNEMLLLALIHKCKHIDLIKKSQWLACLQKKHFTMIREVIPLINQGLLDEWITRELIIDRLADEDISLATTMYDYGTYEVKTGVVEAMLYRAAFVGDRSLFERIINDDISANSTLDGGESLLNCLIRERRREFVQLVIRSRNGSWFMEKKNLLGKLSLHVCIEDDYWDVTDQLIAETRSINEQDNDGNTALSLLLTKISGTADYDTIGRLMTSVKLLINKSADVYLVNRLNRTVISYCTKPDLTFEIESFFRGQQPRQPHVDEVVPANIRREVDPRNCVFS